MIDICKRFSVRYYLNLVLIDEDDRCVCARSRVGEACAYLILFYAEACDFLDMYIFVWEPACGFDFIFT